MRLLRIAAFFGLLAAFGLSSFAQDRGSELRTAFARAQHLRHGINASEWFAQHAFDYSAAFTNRYTDDSDIVLMAKIGFDSVRLSIDPAPLEREPHNHDGLNTDLPHASITRWTPCWPTSWRCRSIFIPSPTTRRRWLTTPPTWSGS